MSKDPAFLFYPGDWNLGTMHMTHLEKGCYIDLLMLQFAKGKFSLAHAKHMLQSSFDLVWPTLKEKFKTDGSFFWNERLELEKEKRARFTDSRKSNALKTKKQPKPNTASAEHMLMHMENENEDINVIKDKEGLGGKKEESFCVDSELQKSILEFFGFTEISDQRKFIEAGNFLNLLHSTSQISHFKKNWEAYRVLKRKDQKPHRFQNFIGSAHLNHSDGAWCAENWSKILNDYEQRNKPATTNHGRSQTGGRNLNIR